MSKPERKKTIKTDKSNSLSGKKDLKETDIATIAKAFLQPNSRDIKGVILHNVVFKQVTSYRELISKPIIASYKECKERGLVFGDTLKIYVAVYIGDKYDRNEDRTSPEYRYIYLFGSGEFAEYIKKNEFYRVCVKIHLDRKMNFSAVIAECDECK